MSALLESCVCHYKANQPSNFCLFAQKLSGIGNYILSECLYRAKIDPFASLRELTEVQQRHLFQEAQAVALESYNSQGMTRKGGSYRSIKGTLGGFQFQLQCYGRETCVKGDRVLKEAEGPHNRAIWYTEKQLFMPLDIRMKQMDLIKEKVVDADSEASVEKTVIPPSNAASDNDDDANDSKSLSYTNVDFARQLQDKGWRRVLGDAMQSKSFQDLQTFLASETATGATIYPPPEDVFAAFNLCPFDNVKVVIVGQDPYHGPGQGHGMAFSVRKGVKPPPSLQNIVREAMEDVSIAKPEHGNLEHWARQGVLLLNTVLTVRHGEANSHKGKGWEEFTDHIIQILNDKKDSGLVFLLWGSPASKKAASVDESKHVVIRTSHPSPLGATKTASPFLGSRCFSRTNDSLERLGHNPVDWTIR